MSCLQGHPAYWVFGGKNTQTGVANTHSILRIKIAYYDITKGKRRRNASPFFFCREREVLCVLRTRKQANKFLPVSLRCCDWRLRFVIARKGLYSMLDYVKSVGLRHKLLRSGWYIAPKMRCFANGMSLQMVFIRFFIYSRCDS